MSNFYNDKDFIKFRRALIYTMVFISLLWIVKLGEWLLGLELISLGIYPRTLTGSLGILTAPLVHGDLVHLLSNSFPLVLLGLGLVFLYPRKSVYIFVMIYLVTGFWVWMGGRSAYHIGASGLVYGLVSYLFFAGLVRKQRSSVAISLVIVFLYSGMIQGLFPGIEGVSWESHLLGAVAGFVAAVYFRKVPMAIEEPKMTPLEESEVEKPPSDGYHYTYTENPFKTKNEYFSYTMEQKDEKSDPEND